MSDKHLVKRKHLELNDTEDSSSSDDVIILLKGLSSKMDALTVSVAENNVAINNIDERLSKKIESLELSVAESVLKVKCDVDAQLANFATDFDQRLTQLATTTQMSCEFNAKACQVISSNLADVESAYEFRFNKMERELLRNELIVTGVPVTYGESMYDIIGDMVNALQSDITASDVVSSYRLPARKTDSRTSHNDRRPAPIVLKLTSDWAKQNILSKYFKMKNLNASDFGHQSKSRVYVNESLTMHNRVIFKAASEAKKSKLISKCYTRNGIVQIQITTEGKTFRINDVDQLNALLSPQTDSSKTEPVSNPLLKPRPDGTCINSNSTQHHLNINQATTESGNNSKPTAST